jgi:putative heme-binding domain-containing protein
LTGVAGRFNQHDLLEAIVEPSKVISDQYQATQFVLADGRTVTGRVVNLSDRGISIMTNMLEPDGQINVERNDVEEILPSPISMMPTGLLDTFDKEEILDLFAYMQAGGARSKRPNSWPAARSARCSRGLPGATCAA